MKTLLSLSVATALVSAGLAAQATDLLLVEQRRDLAGRTKMLKVLQKRNLKQLYLEKANPRQVLTALRAATGKKINFWFFSRTTKASKVPKVSLHLRSTSIANAMALIESQTGLRFVYRSGAVLLRPKSEVKVFRSLRFYDVRAATFRVTKFKAPKLGLGRSDVAPDDDEEGEPIHGFDAERLAELIRTHVSSDSWGDGASISVTRGILVVRHTAAGHRAVRRFLAKFGVGSTLRSRVRRR